MGIWDSRCKMISEFRNIDFYQFFFYFYCFSAPTNQAIMSSTEHQPTRNTCSGNQLKNSWFHLHPIRQSWLQCWLLHSPSRVVNSVRSALRQTVEQQLQETMTAQWHCFDFVGVEPASWGLISHSSTLLQLPLASSLASAQLCHNSINPHSGLSYSL